MKHNFWNGGRCFFVGLHSGGRWNPQICSWSHETMQAKFSLWSVSSSGASTGSAWRHSLHCKFCKQTYLEPFLCKERCVPQICLWWWVFRTLDKTASPSSSSLWILASATSRIRLWSKSTSISSQEFQTSPQSWASLSLMAFLALHQNGMSMASASSCVRTEKTKNNIEI